MKSLERELKRYGDGLKGERPGAERVKAAACRARQAFYEGECRRTLSRMEFLYQQSHFIHKRWWILQGLLLLALWGILQTVDSGYYLRRCMGIMAPSFALLLVPELWKNRNAQSMEIEGTALYSLRQVYGARILLFAMVDLLLLSAFFGAAVLTGRVLPADLLIQFFLPFNVSCCICFRTLVSRRFGSDYGAVFLCLLFSWLWLQVVWDERIYGRLSLPVWFLLLGLSCLYLGYSAVRSFQTCEKMWEWRIS